MDKPQMKVTIPVQCPECHAETVILQLLTSYGSYCRCDSCGHLWHHDKPMKPEPGSVDATARR